MNSNRGNLNWNKISMSIMEKVSKVIDGYIARDGNEILFSDQPMKQSGFFGDGDVWYQTIEKEERSPVNFRVDMHKYMDIPELTKDESPRRCKITIEVGDFYGEKFDPDFIERRGRILKNIRVLAEETGHTFEEAKEILKKSLPEIEQYLDKE